VKRVTENRGGKTPGVDRTVWRTTKQKMEAVLSLKKRGYRTKPLKRIYIGKKNKKLRPLSIPTMKCRGMQALHLLALEPVVEMIADKNSYGFRSKRSTADAIEQGFKCLAKEKSAEYVLEGDIENCFNNIDHSWLLNNIVMDKSILKKWLEAGYIYKGKFHNTFQGTSQGSPISPIILNATMSGLERTIKSEIKSKDKVNVIIYADDVIITGATKEILERKVRPTIERFLNERGLNLSQEKTKITHIRDGFNFLGSNVRKYGQKLLIKPSKENIKSFLKDVRTTIKSHRNIKTEELISIINPKTRGWGNYYRHCVSKATYSRIDHEIYKTLWKWIKRKHPKKGVRWRKNKYFRNHGLQNWVFHAKVKSNENKTSTLDLLKMSSIKIKRHVKVKSEATPYDPAYIEYFKERERKRKQGIGTGLSIDSLIKARA
jgi:RNA-directed DNA polymerase